MPNFFMREIIVVRFMSMRAAAPSGLRLARRTSQNNATFSGMGSSIFG
jgi:hypothetical protein